MWAPKRWRYRKLPKITENYRKLPKTAKNHLYLKFPLLCTGLRYWSQFFSVILLKWPPNRWRYQKLLKITRNYRKLPKMAKNHLYWTITLYSIEILISIYFLLYFWSDPKKLKVLWIAANYRKLSKTAKHNLYWSITLYLIEILTSILFKLYPWSDSHKMKVP